MTAPIVVFDLDGTLVDTAPDLIDTLNLILRRLGYPAVAFEDARAMVGAGVKVLLQRGLASKGIEPPAAQVDQLFEEYLEYYAAHVADLSVHMIEKAPPDLSRLLLAPMPGLVTRLDVAVGDKVEPGQPVAVMEAMKMENILRAPKAATVKATPVKAGESVAVDQVIVEFSDNGPGIAAEHLPFVGQPFFTTKEGGTGLGLAIAQRIVERHGGALTLMSSPGEGTTVRVALARAPETALQVAA